MDWAKRIMGIVKCSTSSDLAKPHHDGEGTSDFMNAPVDQLIERLDKDIALIDEILASHQVEAVHLKLIDEIKAQGKLSWRQSFGLVRWVFVKPAMSARDMELLNNAISVQVEFNKRKAIEVVSASAEDENLSAIRAMLLDMDMFRGLLNRKSAPGADCSPKTLRLVGADSVDIAHGVMSPTEEDQIDGGDDEFLVLDE